MATKKKSTTALWIALGLAAAGVAAYFIFRKKKDEDQPEVGGVLPGSGAAPAPGSLPAPSVFPLKTGSRGKEVVALQRFLNQSDSTNKLVTDGTFGALTYRAWLKEQMGPSVSQEYYNNFVKRFEV